MGPMFAGHTGHVEMYYTEDFAPGKTAPGYTLYEHNRPLLFGKEILPHYEDVERREVVITHMTLSLLGADRLVEIRHNRKFPQEGVAIFNLEGTYVVYHWHRVSQAEALQSLADGIRLVQAQETEFIAAFDKELAERREAAKISLTQTP